MVISDHDPWASYMIGVYDHRKCPSYIIKQLTRVRGGYYLPRLQPLTNPGCVHSGNLMWRNKYKLITGNAEYKFPNPGSTCTRAKKPHILDSTSMMNADKICHVQETLFLIPSNKYTLQCWGTGQFPCSVGEPLPAALADSLWEDLPPKLQGGGLPPTAALALAEG